MAHFFIFHGIEGHSKENWFPWLQAELQSLGHTCTVPDFPNSHAPKLQQWLNHLNTYEIPDDAIFVGHSLGVAFALAALETHQAQAAYLASGFIHLMDNEYGPRTADFVNYPFSWQKIRQNCSEFHVIHGEDDPLCPLEGAQEIADHLQAPLTLIKDGGHLNSWTGYDKFPELLQKIQQDLS